MNTTNNPEQERMQRIREAVRDHDTGLFGMIRRGARVAVTLETGFVVSAVIEASTRIRGSLDLLVSIPANPDTRAHHAIVRITPTGRMRAASPIKWYASHGWSVGWFYPYAATISEADAMAQGTIVALRRTPFVD